MALEKFLKIQKCAKCGKRGNHIEQTRHLPSIRQDVLWSVKLKNESAHFLFIFVDQTNLLEPVVLPETNVGTPKENKPILASVQKIDTKLTTWFPMQQTKSTVDQLLTISHQYRF